MCIDSHCLVNPKCCWFVQNVNIRWIHNVFDTWKKRKKVGYRKKYLLPIFTQGSTRLYSTHMKYIVCILPKWGYATLWILISVKKKKRCNFIFLLDNMSFFQQKIKYFLKIIIISWLALRLIFINGFICMIRYFKKTALLKNWFVFYYLLH